MKKFIVGIVVIFAVLLLIPPFANGQSSDRIILLEDFGQYDREENIFIFGKVTSIQPDSFLILEIVNPNGDLCRIQQLIPLSNGIFVTDSIPLQGRICGFSGDYKIKLFYGDYSKTSSFTVTTTTYDVHSEEEYFDNAVRLISQKIISLDEKLDESFLQYSDRLDTIASSGTLIELEDLYVELWNTYFLEEELFELTPTFRPAATAALDYSAELLESDDLSFDISKSIDKATFSAMFYYEIGNTANAIDIINDVFVSIKNVNPIKTTQQSLSFAELEETLLNLMIKTNSVMSKEVKEQIAFIFARGTAPLYAEELDNLVDLLSKSRYLDVISRKDNSLYRLIQNDWNSIKPSMIKKSSIEELNELHERVAKLHEASLILRALDNVDRFISSDRDENSELANLIKPEWDSLESQLELASSVDDIINSQTKIQNMKNAIDISSRLSRSIEISTQTGIDSDLLSEWESLLIQVETANSIDEILSIVSEFDSSITELREKRSPISILKFEYQAMKEQAELQADYDNLVMIDNALKILDTTKKIEEGNPTVNRIDRIEVLLTWVAEKAPIIKSDLNSYSKDAYKVRASDILQRAKSIENLIEVSLPSNRFLTGYVEFTETIKERVDQVRDLVIKDDLDAADKLVRELFAEWRQVNEKYQESPDGSDVGYSKDEIKKIEYRERLKTLSNAVTNFYNVNFESYASEYEKMSDDAYEMIDYGNFIDADLKINQIGNYLSKHLTFDNEKIIYDMSYDSEKDIWIISGFVDKSVQDRREDLYLTIYDSNKQVHSSLKFSNTKHGKFYTQWDAPAEPGMYVVIMQYQNSQASQIVNIEEKITRSYSAEDLDIVELAREFEELETFMEEFGSAEYQNNPRVSSITNDIKLGLSDRNTGTVDEKLDDLRRAIERYLPVRSRSAVVETQYENDQLYVSGAVQKTLSFREDLFIDIFDQRGNHVDEIALKDTSSGHFNEVLSIPLSPGSYVVQLEYHDLFVTDFFTVR